MGTSLSSQRTPSSVCAHDDAQLTQRYSNIASQLSNRGFDRTAVTAASSSFTGSPPRPRRYAEPPWSLPPNAVRVVVLPFDDEALTDRQTRRLADLALQAAKELVDSMPEGTMTWLPTRGLHSTIFHPGVAPGTIGRAGELGPTIDQLQQELRTMRRLAAGLPINLSFKVDRLAVTSSGGESTSPAAAWCPPYLASRLPRMPHCPHHSPRPYCSHHAFAHPPTCPPAHNAHTAHPPAPHTPPMNHPP